MKTQNDPIFEPETTGERIANFIGNIFSNFIVASIIVTIIALITIIGVELGSAI